MRTVNFFCVCSIIFLFYGCGNNFLDIKRDQSMVVPESIEDFQALMDNTGVMNISSLHLPEIATDDFIVPDQVYNSLSSVLQRQAYIWQFDNMFEGQSTDDWDRGYKKILFANVAIEGLNKIENKDEMWKTVMGRALFFKAEAYFHLVQVFCTPYQPATVNSVLGLVLKHSANVNENLKRSSLEETYGEILSLLHQAVDFLEVDVETVSRPSKAAAHALLTRVYLSMGDYSSALKHASHSLKYKHDVLDYSTIDHLLPKPFDLYNKETVYYANNLNVRILLSNVMFVSQDLVASHHPADLRKNIYYQKEGDAWRFKGSYGEWDSFTGITVPEMLLSKAECELRLGDGEKAKETLRILIEKRYQGTDYESEINVMSTEALLRTILSERRKELLFRGIRWFDLRRLSAIENEHIKLNRMVSGKGYELVFDGKKEVFPIPDKALENSEIKQND